MSDELENIADDHQVADSGATDSHEGVLAAVEEAPTEEVAAAEQEIVEPAVLKSPPKKVQEELDPVKRAAFYIKANDIMWQDTVVIPVLHRLKVGAATNSLRPVLSGWTNDTDNIQDWYRET